MTPAESLAWLDSTQFFGVKLGLENTRRLLAHLGNPERGLWIFHVAGTNGKGSVCAMLDSIFRAAGLKSGLYTSPHLVDFRERIRVGGKMISADATARTLTRLHGFCAAWPHSPTFFELSTALALAHFAEEGCDVVVLETGMGGTLDATNAVTPVVSAITPVAVDHAEWLGDSVEKIAGEKAGIIKPGVPVVSAPQSPEAAEVLRAKAAECGSRLAFVDRPYPGEVGLEGGHQKWNAAVAVAAIRESGFSPGDKAVANGLRNVRWPARFQMFGDAVVLDGAHNPHAAAVLVRTWRERFGDLKPAVVFGAMKDKDCREMLAILSEIAGEFLFAPVANPRSSDPGDLLQHARVPAKTFPALEAAVEAALRGPSPALVTGSLFLAGEALPILEKRFPGPAVLR